VDIIVTEVFNHIPQVDQVKIEFLLDEAEFRGRAIRCKPYNIKVLSSLKNLSKLIKNYNFRGVKLAEKKKERKPISTLKKNP